MGKNNRSASGSREPKKSNGIIREVTQNLIKNKRDPNKESRRPRNGQAGEPSNPEKVSSNRERDKKIEGKLQREMKHRDDLEQSILSLIGGKTGMMITWENLLQSAFRGDDRGFLFYASSFPQKAEILNKYFNELMVICKQEKYKKISHRYELARQLTLPYKNETECRELLDDSAKLAESGLLERTEIDEEELRAWYEHIRQEEEK